MDTPTTTNEVLATLGMRQRALALAMGVSFNTVHRWAAGKVDPPLSARKFMALLVEHAACVKNRPPAVDPHGLSGDRIHGSACHGKGGIDGESDHAQEPGG